MILKLSCYLMYNNYPIKNTFITTFLAGVIGIDKHHPLLLELSTHILFALFSDVSVNMRVSVL